MQKGAIAIVDLMVTVLMVIVFAMTDGPVSSVLKHFVTYDASNTVRVKMAHVSVTLDGMVAIVHLKGASTLAIHTVNVFK